MARIVMDSILTENFKNFKNFWRENFKLPEDELEAELLDTDDDVAEVALVAGFLDLFAFTMELPKKMTKFFKTGIFRNLRGT